jgi:hypothetical protein
MSSYKAIIFSEVDVNKITFGKPKKHNQGSVVNVKYNDRQNFVIQTPLMNTFGISTYNDKWTLGLSFSYSNGLSEDDLLKFQKVIEDIEEKVLTDLANGLYKDWLGVGDKWDKFSIDLKREMVSSKYNKSLLRYSKKHAEKKYAPTMNIKLNKKRDTSEFNVDTFMMDSENRIICNEKGEYIEFDIKEHLYSEDSEEKRIRPRVYCLFSMSIWIINGNIFLTPVCNQILIQPVKSTIQRVTFNEKGFTRVDEKFDMEDEDEMDSGEGRAPKEVEQEFEDDDNDEPVRV